MPFAGRRSDIPRPRARAPSPIQKVTCTPTPPAPARDFDIDPAEIDVIYAEDEEVFRETAVRILVQVGFNRDRIHEAVDGNGALEHLARLQMEGNCTLPLVVLLDVRMPGMDGRECALQIQELVKKKLLRREPFVICISSIHHQVIVDEGKGNFQVVLPKPFDDKMVGAAIDSLRKWWVLGHGRVLPAWKPFTPEQIDIIAADDEPVCRLSACTAFIKAGVSPGAVCEVDSEEDLLGAVQEAQDGSHHRPLVVLLGKVSWAGRVSNGDARNMKRRDPFVVCTSVDSDRLQPSLQQFHAFMPATFSRADVDWCLEFCRLWWLTRGDGPDVESDNESNHGSAVSEASDASDASH